MTIDQIRSLGPALAGFLYEFSDCFTRSDTQSHLRHYVCGQLSDLPRKSVQPIADLAGVPPRTLQEFLALSDWDSDRLRDHVQQIVARDHADPYAIAIIDDSGHPKKGDKTACVHRQYCGNTGKIDNCVVTVHLSLASYDNRFRTMLDSTLFLPKDVWDDPARRAEAEIPADLVYRPKYDIALEQFERSLGNGLHFAWVTADEWYADKPKFIAGLELLGQRFVLEIPRDFRGWLFLPGNPHGSAKVVDNLCRFSRPMMQQPWTRFHVKNTEKGAMLWQAKAAPFWIERDGQVLGPYWLVFARNVLDPREEKFFFSNASPGTPLEVILHVAFSRWPIERCLEDEKTELGLSHFEVRKYPAIVRHLYLTQVSHLFLAREAKRLRGEKPGDHAVPSPHRRRIAARCVTAEPFGPSETPAANRRTARTNPERQRQSALLAHQSAAHATRPPRHLA